MICKRTQSMCPVRTDDMIKFTHARAGYLKIKSCCQVISSQAVLVLYPNPTAKLTPN